MPVEIWVDGNQLYDSGDADGDVSNVLDNEIKDPTTQIIPVKLKIPMMQFEHTFQVFYSLSYFFIGLAPFLHPPLFADQLCFA